MKKMNIKKDEKYKNKSKSKVKHRRKKYSLFNYRAKLILSYSFIFCFVVGLALLISSFVLFKIDKIEVQGDSVCDETILIEKSGFKTGENLIFADSKGAKDKLEKEIPQIEDVSIKKKIPNMIVLEVKRAEKVFAIENNEKYIIINEKGKVLEISEEVDAGIILLQGVEIDDYVVGTKVTYKDLSLENKISEILNSIKANNLLDVKEIDFKDCFNIIVNYDNRIKLNLGMYENVDYKLRIAAEILNNRIGNNETGVLNLSDVSKENRSYFMPDS